MIPIYQPYFGGREKEYVNQCLDSTWISSRGEFISRFESAFAAYIGAQAATTVSNGTVALHLAMEALGIGSGDEVIVPTFTYVASVNTILQTGATPVFVDSLEMSWNVDPGDIRRKITNRTRAVLVVHLYGLSCDMDAITDLCREHSLLLIEDCAEAMGSYYGGCHVGTFGDAATFSFFGNKTITTGEGGMVVFRRQDTYEIACHLKSQGVSKTREYWHDVLGYNYRMTNICAAIGLAQLEQVNEVLQKKRVLSDWYRELLSPSPIAFQEYDGRYIHSNWMISIVVESTELRDFMRAQLKNGGVETRPLFPPTHQMPHCYYDGQFPVAQRLSAQGMSLPSFPELSRAQVEYICRMVNETVSASA